MKKLLVMFIALALAGTASAQKLRGHRSHYYVRPRVSVGVGLGAYPFFSPFSPYYYMYGPAFGYPYPYGYYRPYHESRLDLQIQDIRNDYQEQISTVRNDASLSRSDRKAKIRKLRHDREQAIIQAKRNYYKY